VIFIYR